MSHRDPDWLPQALPSYDFEAEAEAIELAEAKEDERMLTERFYGSPESEPRAQEGNVSPLCADGSGEPSLSADLMRKRA